MLDDFRKKYGRASDVIPDVDTDFVGACLFLLTEAYKRMKAETKYDPAWKETRFSAVLIGYMDNVQREEDLPIQIAPESYQYSQAILEGQDDPDTAPRIDIKMSGNWIDRDVYFCIEGKILVEKDWQTRQASYLRGRYIDTGIDNFVEGRYSPVIPKGCVAGYVVHGDPQNVASKINNLLEHRDRKSEFLRDRHSINECPDCYRSAHTRATDTKHLELRHVLLLFD